MVRSLASSAAAAATPPVLVIGAGIFGLSVAYAARRAGARVAVIEAGTVPGCGASGGVVGALTPHTPVRWSPFTAFHFRALLDLAGHIREIEQVSGGLGTGYMQTGRWTPLTTQHRLDAARADAAAAAVVWGNAASLTVLDTLPEAAAGWLAPEAAAYGVQTDTVSARVNPRAYVLSLAAALQNSGVAISCGVGAARVFPDGSVVTTEGTTLRGQHIVIAGGSGAWDMLRPLAPLSWTLDGTGGVKGQAALLALDFPPPPTLIYADGLYVIPHDSGVVGGSGSGSTTVGNGDANGSCSGLVAVGSTSEKEWALPSDTDDKLDQLVARAQTVVPNLSNARIIRRWAGVRPKPPRAHPVAGPVPGTSSVWVAGGGFKIGFGIAHAIADGLVAQMLPDLIEAPLSNPLPKTFSPEVAFAATKEPRPSKTQTDTAIT
eukprot:m.409498 g.409498  ORF g.409498 m.409498 type:complete len:433 (+) comp20155_c2_seq9:302-1600(+)